MLGKILSIEEVTNVKLDNTGSLNGGNGSRLGLSQMIDALRGYGSYDGYKIKTDIHEFYILIDNEQSCCESWGYFSSEDAFEPFIGKYLMEIVLTDKALNSKRVEESDYYDDGGGIQFVNFNIADGTVLQFAVYNAHNGYYGLPIIFAKDEEVFHQDTL